jgi:hypothetical protein
LTDLTFMTIVTCSKDPSIDKSTAEIASREDFITKPQPSFLPSLIVISYHLMKLWLSILLNMPRTGSLHNGMIELFRPSEQHIDIEYVLASRQVVILANHLVRIVSSLFMVCKVTLGEHGLMKLQKCAGLATFFPTTSRMPGSCRGGITPTQILWAVRQQAQTGSYSMLGRWSRSFKMTER